MRVSSREHSSASSDFTKLFALDRPNRRNFGGPDLLSVSPIDLRFRPKRRNPLTGGPRGAAFDRLSTSAGAIGKLSSTKKIILYYIVFAYNNGEELNFSK